MKPYRILAYYFYTPLADAEKYAEEHLNFCKQTGIRGRIIVADEGINGTVSGTVEACEQYMQHLQNDARFEGIEFKVDEAEDHAFFKIHVRYKPEIVHSGLREKIKPYERTGTHLSGEEFLKLKEKENVVVLDVRSNYEHKVGKFKNAMTLDMDNFREFPDKLSELEHLKDKTIITYCTGGIKCEKASAFLLENGFTDVYQLDGGIIKYAKETGGKDFDGVCYVFDGRITIPVNSVNPHDLAVCYICGTACSRMVNCANPECNVHVPICEKCGVEMDGACSPACKEHPRKREYNGTGYYVKTNPTL